MDQIYTNFKTKNMEASNILSLFLGSLVAMLAIISSRALTKRRMEAIQVQVRDQISREELQKKKIDALYGRD